MSADTFLTTNRRLITKPISVTFARPRQG